MVFQYICRRVVCSDLMDISSLNIFQNIFSPTYSIKIFVFSSLRLLVGESYAASSTAGQMVQC